MAHGQRIMMKIFRLPNGSMSNNIYSLLSSQTLQGKYLEDRNSDGTITLSVDNTPGISWSSRQQSKVKVEQNSDGTYYVIVVDSASNLQRFILLARKDATQINTLYNTAGQPIPNEFTLYVNPQRVSPVANKRLTEVLTRGGYEIQHWGNALTEIQVTGKTGALFKTSTGAYPTDTSIIDVTQSLAWKRLSQLRDLYDTDHAVKNQEALVLLGLNYYDKFYTGYFTSFTGPTASAENPYQIDYSFTFKVQKEQTITRG
ncbi:MAG: hypothetical protein WC346_10080 [Methanogenium sp.]|jgi:hypothetical protein